MPLDRLRNLFKSLLDSNNTNDILCLYTRRYNPDFLNSECLEILVHCIVETAREILEENTKFNFDSFLCIRCNDIIKDPITLKCGHTFSKKCVLSEIGDESFSCLKCSKNYSFSYLSQLKNNVTILSLVEKLYDRYLLRHKRNRTACNGNRLDKMHEGHAYLVSDKECTEVPSFIFAATSSVLHKMLQTYSCSLSCLTNFDSIENNKILIRDPIIHRETLLRSSRSSDSLHIAEDDRSSSDEEEAKNEPNNCSDRIDLYLMLENFFDWIKKIREEKSILSRIDVTCLDKREFECPLCMRILWEPVTTTCGHTFCRVCLNRCLDHQPACPLCKASLTSFLAERVQNTTEFLELAIKNLFPLDYTERKEMYLEEMEELTNAGKDLEHEIPLFICTVALPTVPCPLHVFEPRYRLMIRQCMESGNRQFGMCGVIDNEIAEYGTMLEIRDVQYFPDGRSIVDTVGRKRFRILRKGERDGYHTGAVEFLEDQPLSDMDLECIEEKHERTYEISKVWFMHLPSDTRHQILQHFGPMPFIETNYISVPDGPSWLWWMLAILPVETRLKVLLVSLTSLPQRLEFLYRILLHFQSALAS